jgi:photosystem II stability/assembly factor-like uncharacterized protein
MKAVLVCLGIVLAVGACKKGTSGPTGGGGGGSSWLVGTDGLMVNVQTSGESRGYPLASTENLNGIACRYSGEAWVVGTHGTLLYTSDAGSSWHPQQVPTSAELRALATQDAGPVFVAGDGVFLASTDTGQHWAELSDGTVSFRSIAAAQQADGVLALSEDGRLFTVNNNQLQQRGNFACARALAISPDGQLALVVGDRMISRSIDGGVSWQPLTGGTANFDAVRIGEDGEALAVGSGGALAHISNGGLVTMQQLGNADLHTIHLAETDDPATAAGFAAGDNGRVFITLDGGLTWHDGPNVGGKVLGADMIGEGHL